MKSEPPWKQYQEEAAAFFRGIGLEAETNVAVEGARGKHNVDVAVRGGRAGLRQLWIVECKRLGRDGVSKDKVMTLAQIVQDVGADRGILVCENGFQAGAIRAATRSNVTLTSLSDLRENAANERDQIEARAILNKLVMLQDELGRHAVVERSPGTARITYPAGVPVEDILPMHARLGMAQSGLLRALAGVYPVLVDIDPRTDVPTRADSLSAAVALAGSVVDYADTRLATWRALPDKA
ncbi:restriction endonuclease [Nocardioides antri]|uniref:Restriction endonuclease n=1 Tax=Nocardioides antri TaxID=2607659 RepID=A0A5B1M4B2_9ACTN|nr:restriction endonuclease [Nocardioides antri]KAA1427486.1 restriction endonuclease [Nocardioides antri]